VASAVEVVRRASIDILWSKFLSLLPQVVESLATTAISHNGFNIALQLAYALRGFRRSRSSHEGSLSGKHRRADVAWADRSAAQRGKLVKTGEKRNTFHGQLP
jgi:hypothetical protein